MCCVSLSYIIANDDPIISLPALTISSNPSPRPIIDVQILREDLYIEPGKNTKVKVKYTLVNNSNKDYDDIDYGFPVDYSGAGITNTGMIDDDFTESMYTVGWRDSYIKSMAFWMNGNALPYTLSEETVVEWVDREALKKNLMEEYTEMGTDEELTDERVEEIALASTTARRWFYTQFSVKAGQTCVLEVEYTLQYHFNIPLYHSNLIYSASNPGSGRGDFFYDMSPAQHWGDGTAKELSIVIDYTKNTLNITDIDLGTLGLPFVEDRQKMTYYTKDFKFKDSQPIELLYNANYYHNYNELLGHRISPSTYTITASDQLEAYPVSNMSDFDFSTTWAIKWDSIQGKELKIVFDKPTLVRAIILVGGYHKSTNTYKNNAQPKTIKVSMNDDWNQSCYLEADKYANNVVQYKGISDDNVLDYSIIFTQPKFSEYEEKPIKEITINIEDIYSGDKFDDLCISEIILLSPGY